MTFKNIKFHESPVMRELERQEIRKNPPKPEPVVKQASIKLELDPNQEFFSQILSLGSLLRKKGFSKEADTLDEKCFLLKQAETHLYRVFDQDGEDMLNFAHPEGDIMSFEAQQGLGKIETLQGVQKAMLDVVKKPATGKQTRSTSDAVVLAAMALGLIKTAEGEDEELRDQELENKNISQANEKLKSFSELGNASITSLIEKINGIAPINVNSVSSNQNYKSFLVDNKLVQMNNYEKFVKLINLSKQLNAAYLSSEEGQKTINDVFGQGIFQTYFKGYNNFDQSLSKEELKSKNDPNAFNNPNSIYYYFNNKKQIEPGHIEPMVNNLKAIVEESIQKWEQEFSKGQTKLEEIKTSAISSLQSMVEQKTVEKIEDLTVVAKSIMTSASQTSEPIKTLTKYFLNADNEFNKLYSQLYKSSQDTAQELIKLQTGKSGDAIIKNDRIKSTLGSIKGIYNLALAYVKNEKNKNNKKNIDICRKVMSKLKAANAAFSSVLKQDSAFYSDIRKVEGFAEAFPNSKSIDEFEASLSKCKSDFDKLGIKEASFNFSLIKKAGPDDLTGLGGGETASSSTGGTSSGGASGGGKKNNNVALMQEMLLNLADSFGTPTGEKLKHQQILRNTGTHGANQQYGDGVWGSHTTEALKVAQIYVPKGQTLILNPTTNVEADAAKNMQILGSIGVNSKKGKQLDSILQSKYNASIVEGKPEQGNINVLDSDLYSLVSFFKFLTVNKLEKPKVVNGEYAINSKDLLKGLQFFNGRSSWLMQNAENEEEQDKYSMYGGLVRKLINDSNNINGVEIKENPYFKHLAKSVINTYIKTAQKIYPDLTYKNKPLFNYNGTNIDQDRLFEIYLRGKTLALGIKELEKLLNGNDDFNKFKEIILGGGDEQFFKPELKNIDLTLSILNASGQSSSQTGAAAGNTSPQGGASGQGPQGRGQGQGLGNPPANVDDPNAPPIGDSINIGVNRFWQNKKAAGFGVKWINLDLMYKNFNDLAKSLFSNQSPDVFTAVTSYLEYRGVGVDKQGPNSKWSNDNISWNPIFQMGPNGWEISPTLRSRYGEIQTVIKNLQNQNVNVQCRNFLLALQNDIPQVAREWQTEMQQLQQNGNISSDRLNREFAKLNRSIGSWTQTISNRLRDIGG